MAQGSGKYNPEDEISLSDLLPDLLETKQPAKTAPPPAYYSAAPGNTNPASDSPPPLPTWAQFVPTEPTTAAPTQVAVTPPPPPVYPGEVAADFLQNPESLYTQPDAPKKKKNSNNALNTGLLLGLGAATLIIPTLVFGLFFVIANSQPEAKPLSGQELENAVKTPLVTIKPDSPGAGAGTGAKTANNTTPGAKTVAPTPTLGLFEFKNDCGYKPTAGRIDAFPCSKPLPTDKAELKPLITAAEKQLADTGHKPVGGARFDYAKDKPERVQEFYAGSLRVMGFTQEQDSPTGMTNLGSYRVLYFTNGQRRIQVAVFNVTAPIPGGIPAPGEVAIRLSAS